MTAKTKLILLGAVALTMAACTNGTDRAPAVVDDASVDAPAADASVTPDEGPAEDTSLPPPTDASEDTTAAPAAPCDCIAPNDDPFCPSDPPVVGGTCPWLDMTCAYCTSAGGIAVACGNDGWVDDEAPACD